jgi:archaellum biogenesis ATPase FlaH|tara:strand:+ start:1446 stop:1727 length:282 start_codon:yes stop_codon:yes gene_type:complete
MNEFLQVAEKVGFPIAGALIAGFFIFIILKFILNELTGSIKSLNNLITGLVNRIDTMNNDIVKIDTLISVAFNKKPNLERLAAADGKEDSRKD